MSIRILVKSPICLAAAVAWLATGRSPAAQSNPGVAPPDSAPYGKSYPEWVAAFWQWALALPLEGHPFADSNPVYNLSAHQSGNVWFWSAPDGPLTRAATLPVGKALFLTLRDVECSSLEAPDSGFHGDTEAEQRSCAKFWADHIVDVFCLIDGEPVNDLHACRFSSPQFDFAAPTPWIFGESGGNGTAVGDGYYLMLVPLSRGQHTIHYGGTFHFEAGEISEDPLDFPKDITIDLTVD